MFVDNTFFSDENVRRLSFGVTGAMLVHALILLWFFFPVSQRTISADIFSPPTNVSIRFVTPIKKQPNPVPKIVKAEPVKKKSVIKKTAIQKPLPETLNKIEPAAAPSQERQPILQPVQNTIPVVSETSLKGRRVQPEYPERSLRMRQEGVVWLRVLISETGARQELKLHKPSQYALLNQAAIKAVKKWTFDPNVVNGRAVRSWVEIPIEFKIQ